MTYLQNCDIPLELWHTFRTVTYHQNCDILISAVFTIHETYLMIFNQAAAYWPFKSCCSIFCLMMLLFPLALKKESCKVGQTCSTLLKLSSDAPLIQNHVTTTQQEEIVKAVANTRVQLVYVLEFHGCLMGHWVGAFFFVGFASWDSSFAAAFLRCSLQLLTWHSFPGKAVIFYNLQNFLNSYYSGDYKICKNISM